MSPHRNPAYSRQVISERGKETGVDSIRADAVRGTGGADEHACRDHLHDTLAEAKLEDKKNGLLLGQHLVFTISPA